ncbi:tetratricopeptide repeat protein [Methylobacter sp.]|uniref:tetratricopeptide repeat protein n=1 Tax=Methylobacter sp. TaxID=2051955 RepID=UPI0011F94728|nr:tetratricopeptide repeat protein [Methylobacter sp.]TAK65184.1 MAG: tetratricopeptide repeat protein [Methylobacter sp.]
MNIKQLLLFILLCFIQKTALSKAAPWVGADFKGLACTGKPQGFGPYDYTNPSHKNGKIGGGGDTALSIVERAHFPPDTENLTKSVFGSFLGDFDYTLRAWPNHHRALLSLVRFQLEVNKKIRKPEKPFSSVECYFQRAINFSPNDSATYSLYAYYLTKIGQFQQAQQQYERALKIASNSSKVEYAYALLLIELKQYDHALEHAKRAYQLGSPPLGLKKKLSSLGIWKDN